MNRKYVFLLPVLFFIVGLLVNLDISPVWGIKYPSSVRVGLSTTETVCDFKVVSGSYQLYAGDCTTPITSPVVGTLYRAAFVPSSTTLELYSLNSDGTWNDLGGFANVSLTTTSDSASLFSYNNKTYRGAMKVCLNKTATALTVVNELPLEQYLYGVVPKEMSNQWPVEALKAQAVAARTYVVKNINKHGADGFDVCDETHCQAYAGYAVEGATSRAAVDATAGQVLVDAKGVLAYALYHSNSGGYTEDNLNVNGYDFPYLKGKPDPYSMGYGLSDWAYQTSVVTDGSGNSLQEKLKAKFPGMGTIAKISLGKWTSGRVYEVCITDENGQQFKLSGKDFGQMFNPGFSTATNKTSFMGVMFDTSTDARVTVENGAGQSFIMDGGMKALSVRSSALIAPFTAGGDCYQAKSATSVKTYPKSPRNLTVVGHGWGHGVGMSQWGAYGMAMQGKTYRDILQFYYEGATVTSLEN